MRRTRSNQRFDRSRSRRLKFLCAVVFLCTAVLHEGTRNRARLLAADAWCHLRPAPLDAAVDAPLGETIAAISERERMLLMRCLRLQSELHRLSPSVHLSDRMVSLDAVRAHVLWSSAGERDLFVSLARESTVNVDNLVVDDSGVDVGALVGIETDGLVLEGRSLVGRVTRVGTRSAGVQPVTSEEFRVLAELVRPSADEIVVGSRGTFSGDGDTGGHLSDVPAELPVRVGDLVTTVPSDTWSGHRIVIGMVARAELVPGEPTWTIDVAPAATLERNDSVLVLRPRVELLGLERRSHASEAALQ